jgi:hypothetical protein
MDKEQEIKNILKSAKEAIKIKEYKEALKLCKVEDSCVLEKKTHHLCY